MCASLRSRVCERASERGARAERRGAQRASTSRTSARAHCEAKRASRRVYERRRRRRRPEIKSTLVPSTCTLAAPSPSPLPPPSLAVIAFGRRRRVRKLAARARARAVLFFSAFLPSPSSQSALASGGWRLAEISRLRIASASVVTQRLDRSHFAPTAAAAEIVFLFCFFLLSTCFITCARAHIRASFSSARTRAVFYAQRASDSQSGDCSDGGSGDNGGGGSGGGGDSGGVASVSRTRRRARARLRGLFEALGK